MPIKKHGDSDAFSPIMLELSKEVKKLESFKKGRLVIIMDNATFNWTKQTRAYLTNLGHLVINSDKKSHEINAIEYTIGNIKAVIKNFRDPNK